MSDGVFFAGILLFFFLLWFVGGGPTRPISFAGPYITPISDIDDVQQGYGSTGGWWSGLPGGSGGSGGGANPAASNRDISQGLIRAESDLWRLQGLAGDIAFFGDPSPYRDIVSITSVSPNETANNEYVTVQVSGNASGPVTISGWKLKSEASDRVASIGNGSELPRTGLNTTAPIMLYPGEQAIISTGESPIGVSFRENMCVGYFGQHQSFYPSLWSSCPSPRQEFERYYDGNKLDDDACYAYVNSLQSCTKVATPPAHLARACRELIEDYLDYNGCVSAHRNETQFKQNRYRVYLERSRPLWKSSREAIKLLDANGKTVDLYTY